MDSITADLTEVIDTLDATRSNSRALDLALALQDLGAKSVTITAEASADPRPVVLIQSDEPLGLNDTDKAQRVTDAARDIGFLADLYAAGQDIENFMRMEIEGDKTVYTIDFGGRIDVYIATARAVLSTQLNTVLSGQMMPLIGKLSGIEDTPATRQPGTDGVRF